MNEYTPGITRDDFAKLAAPFPSKDHEFIRGFIYLEETAICRRIEEVDLSWEWKTVEMTFENDTAAVVGALTICGVTRYGTGQQLAQIDSKGKESVGEARKGATTDALKRAARLFGIGRYLLDCPKSVKDYGPELDKWLKDIARQQGLSIAEQSRSMQPAPVPTQDPVSHWSLDSVAMEKMYQWAADKHGATKDDVNAAIRATGKTILSLEKTDVMAAVSTWTVKNKKAS